MDQGSGSILGLEGAHLAPAGTAVFREAKLFEEMEGEAAAGWFEEVGLESTELPQVAVGRDAAREALRRVNSHWRGHGPGV